MTKSTLQILSIITFAVGLVLLTALVTTVGASSSKYDEAYYGKIDCSTEDGMFEFRNTDGTWTDCYTGTNSIEYDFAPKWYQCLQQALHYARMNGNRAECRLIVITENDNKLAARALMNIAHYGQPITLNTIQGIPK